MDQVEVEVIQTEVAQRPLNSGADVDPGVVGVPQLRRDPQLVAMANAVAERRPDAGADLGLIAVVAGTIEVTIADPERLVYQGRRLGLRNLPQPQADERHAGA